MPLSAPLLERKLHPLVRAGRDRMLLVDVREPLERHEQLRRVRARLRRRADLLLRDLRVSWRRLALRRHLRRHEFEQRPLRRLLSIVRRGADLFGRRLRVFERRPL